jgi:enoyl-CoA hydratase
MDSRVTDLQFETIAGTAWAILDRPKALNALCVAMIEALADWLSKSLADNSISCLGVRSAHATAFSAGGDVRALYARRQAGDQAFLHGFYWHEYRLNRAIRHCRKPYIALIDGLVMGGGAGVSINGSHRIVGPNARFAMPETGIGFFPDVGASWFLSRCPGQIGVYLGLTGEILGPADMLHAGIATHYLPAGVHLSRYSEVAGLPVEAGEARLAAQQDAIDRCFAGNSVETILTSLGAENSDWARGCAAKLRQRAPLALKVTLKQLRLAPSLTFDDAMMMEYRLARHFMAGKDFFEGVRAAVIDKDRNPRWQPGSLAEVSDDLVESYFAPANGPDLSFDEGRPA